MATDSISSDLHWEERRKLIQCQRVLSVTGYRGSWKPPFRLHGIPIMTRIGTILSVQKDWEENRQMHYFELFPGQHCQVYVDLQQPVKSCCTLELSSSMQCQIHLLISDNVTPLLRLMDFYCCSLWHFHQSCLFRLLEHRRAMNFNFNGSLVKLMCLNFDKQLASATIGRREQR